MADYADITITSTPQALSVVAEDTIIYAHGGPLRFTSHLTPIGNTIGVPLATGQFHLIKANNAITAWSDASVPVTLVRITA